MAAEEHSGVSLTDIDWNLPNFHVHKQPDSKDSSKEFVNGWVDGRYDSENVRRVLEAYDERHFSTFIVG